jgi:hypothetical protein
MSGPDVTHIRKDRTSTYCGADPHETISHRHYAEGKTDSPQAGHVATLPSALCGNCVHAVDALRGEVERMKAVYQHHQKREANP